MKKIVLNTAYVDEAGNFCDAGAELELVASDKDKGKAGFIDPERARELVASGSAVSATAAAEIERAAAQEPEAEPVKPKKA